MAAPDEKPKVSEKEKAAESREAGAVPTAPAPAPEPKKAELSRAEKARADAIGAAKFRITGRAVGAHVQGDVVERTKLANFSADRNRVANDQEIEAGIGRLIDKGVIAPVEEEEK